MTNPAGTARTATTPERPGRHVAQLRDGPVPPCRSGGRFGAMRTFSRLKLLSVAGVVGFFVYRLLAQGRSRRTRSRPLPFAAFPPEESFRDPGVDASAPSGSGEIAAPLSESPAPGAIRNASKKRAKKPAKPAATGARKTLARTAPQQASKKASSRTSTKSATKTSKKPSKKSVTKSVATQAATKPATKPAKRPAV